MKVFSMFATDSLFNGQCIKVSQNLRSFIWRARRADRATTAFAMAGWMARAVLPRASNGTAIQPPEACRARDF
jgi:hypothetical protein